MSEALGIEGLALEGHHCRLQAQGEDPTLDLDYIEEGELVVLSCPPGPVAKQRREAVMAPPLRANCFRQGTGGRATPVVGRAICRWTAWTSGPSTRDAGGLRGQQ